MKPAIRILDDRNTEFVVREPVARVVSLVPSDTYSLFALGAGDRLVGRTKYCVAPAPDVERIAVVGGTKDADVDQIVALAPDLVIANREENTRRDVERLEARGVKVFVCFPRTVAAGVGHLARLARVLGLERDDRAREAVAFAYGRLRAFEALRGADKAAGRAPVRVFLPIWMDPLMTANDDTFLADVLELVGCVNVFGDRDRLYPLAADLGRAQPLSAAEVAGRDTRYPRVTLAEVTERAPDLVLLPDEPHAFTEADAAVFRALAIPAATRGRVVFCDGKDLMWYGARSVEGLERLRERVESARNGS